MILLDQRTLNYWCLSQGIASPFRLVRERARLALCEIAFNETHPRLRRVMLGRLGPVQGFVIEPEGAA